jgi:hypothetical protein
MGQMDSIEKSLQLRLDESSAQNEHDGNILFEIVSKLSVTVTYG